MIYTEDSLYTAPGTSSRRANDWWRRTRRPSGKEKEDNGESLCQNGRGGTRAQTKEKQAMVQSGGLDFGRSKESHKTEANRCKIRETKTEMDKWIGKLRDRLGWIGENGLKRLEKKLKMRLNNNTWNTVYPDQSIKQWKTKAECCGNGQNRHDS